MYFVPLVVEIPLIVAIFDCEVNFGDSGMGHILMIHHFTLSLSLKRSGKFDRVVGREAGFY